MPPAPPPAIRSTISGPGLAPTEVTTERRLGQSVKAWLADHFDDLRLSLALDVAEFRTQWSSAGTSLSPTTSSRASDETREQWFQRHRQRVEARVADHPPD
jgi:hypothetical protein